MRTKPAVPPSGTLSDGVVGVRLRRAEDLPAIAEASHDPTTRHWLTDEPLDEQAVATSLERASASWASGHATPMVIVDATTDAATGLINLALHSDREAALAYSVFPTRRGRGIAPRAVRLVTRWAHDQLDIERVLLEAEPGNTASIRVAEKCGFERTGERVEIDPAGSRTLAVFVSAHQRAS